MWASTAPQGKIVHKIDKDLSRVLVLQDLVGTSKSAHFDHDANAITGPTDRVRRKRAPGVSAKTVSKTVTLMYVRDRDTGEILGI